MDTEFIFTSEMINNTDRACLFCDKELKRIFFEHSHFGGVYFCLNRECKYAGILTIATKKLELPEETIIEEAV